MAYIWKDIFLCHLCQEKGQQRMHLRRRGADFDSKSTLVGLLIHLWGRSQKKGGFYSDGQEEEEQRRTRS